MTSGDKDAPLSMPAACRRAVALLSVLVWSWAAALVSTSLSAPITGLTLTTEEPGNLFVESMPAAIRATITGGEPESLSWVVADRQGVRGWRGTVDPKSVRNEDGTYSLALPGKRGLFTVEVTASGDGGAVRSSLPYAVALDPAPVDSGGYWGVFLIPYTGRADLSKAREQALRLRRLGTQWVRLNFWLQAFEHLRIESEDPPRIQVRFEKYGTIVKAMREQGIRVMGEFCHVPEALSSKPGRKTGNSDAGPLYARVPPRNWALWEHLVAQTVSAFGDDIEAWEIWNEPNIGGRYWAGTVEEFSEMVSRTSATIRRVRPETPVVVGGFTCSTAARENGPEFVTRLFELGLADHMDVFSSHSFSDDYRRILDANGLSQIPVWDTEQHELASLKTLRMGVDRIFHFYSRLDRDSLTDLPALTDTKGQPLAAGITFALAAKLIGNATWVSGESSATGEYGILKRGDEMLLVAKVPRPGLVPGQLTVEAEAFRGRAPEWFSASGEAHPIALDPDSKAVLPMAGFLVTRWLRRVCVTAVSWPERPPDPEQVLVSANTASFSGKWGLGEGRAIWVAEEPGPEGYVAQLPFHVPRDDQYRLYLDGTIAHRLEGNRSISPFVWSLDGGRTRLVDRALPMLWREGNAKYAANEPVDPPEIGQYLGGDQVWQELGTVLLAQGRHTFRLELVDRRRWPDNAWCFEFFGLLLRPVRDDVPTGTLRPAAVPRQGIAVPLTNAGFERFDPRNGREAPEGWTTRERTIYTATGYEAAEGEAATLFFPGAGGRQQLSQDIPSGRLAALLGRPLREDDVLIVRVSVRHYWEEHGGVPDQVAVVFSSRERPVAPFAPRLRCALPGSELKRRYEQMDARYTLTAADIARGAPMWRITLESAASAAKSGVLWDTVQLSVTQGVKP